MFQMPDVFGLGDAAVFAGLAEELRLHPERTALRFRMPERLAARAAAYQVEALPLPPGLRAVARLHPGEAIDIYTLRGLPLLVRGLRVIFKCARRAVAGHQVPGVEFAIERDAPVEQVVRFFDAVLQPVKTFRIAAELVGRLNVFPAGIAGSMPRFAYTFERPVPEFEPVAKLVLARFAEAVHLADAATVIGGLIPEIVPKQRRMPPIVFDELCMEVQRQCFHVSVVETQARKTAGAA